MSENIIPQIKLNENTFDSPELIEKFKHDLVRFKSNTEVFVKLHKLSSVKEERGIGMLTEAALRDCFDIIEDIEQSLIPSIQNPEDSIFTIEYCVKSIRISVAYINAKLNYTALKGSYFDADNFLS